jgi:hypothetical protein
VVITAASASDNSVTRINVTSMFLASAVSEA